LVAYKLDPTQTQQFTPSGGSAYTMVGCTDVSITESGDPVDLSTDGSPHIQAVFIDNIAVEATVSFTKLPEGSLKAGMTGSLVLKAIDRASSGSGVGSDTITMTMPKATVVDISPTVATGGLSTVAVRFRCAGDATTYPIAYS
jgi:hypothetical protein